MSAKEVLRRIVLMESGEYSDAIPVVLRAMFEGIHIAWAKVDGRTVSVYCYSKLDAKKLAQHMGGHGRRARSPRDPSDKYWLWTWQAPMSEIS